MGGGVRGLGKGGSSLSYAVLVDRRLHTASKPDIYAQRSLFLVQNHGPYHMVAIRSVHLDIRGVGSGRVLITLQH